MGLRLDLHQILCDILGTTHVYFQPPASVRMSFPCIIYSLKDIDSKYADDLTYHNLKCYTVTVVDRDPDTVIPDKIGELRLASFDRHYTADNLNHYVYSLYF